MNFAFIGATGFQGACKAPFHSKKSTIIPNTFVKKRIALHTLFKPCVCISRTKSVQFPTHCNSKHNDDNITTSKQFIPAQSDIILPTKYNIPIVLNGFALTFAGLGDGWTVLSFPFLLLGIFLTIQTTIVRFIFTDTELVVAKKRIGEQSTSLDFIRSWKYSEFVNWEVWWEQFPVLCYYKENESYNGRGSIHFFPILFDCKALVNAFQTRSGITKSNYTQS